MDLNSSSKVINLFLDFKSKYERTIEKDLYNRYSKRLEKLTKIIEHIESNYIDDKDESIQIELNNFLEYLASSDQNITFTDKDKELIIIKLVKLKLAILHKIKNNELDGLSELASEIKVIQAKKEISVKEFTKIYGVSESSQATYRGRLYDSLPYHQKVRGGKITYIVKEVENWKENQHK